MCPQRNFAFKNMELKVINLIPVVDENDIIETTTETIDDATAEAISLNDMREAGTKPAKAKSKAAKPAKAAKKAKEVPAPAPVAEPQTDPIEALFAEFIDADERKECTDDFMRALLQKAFDAGKNPAKRARARRVRKVRPSANSPLSCCCGRKAAPGATFST